MRDVAPSDRISSLPLGETEEEKEEEESEGEREGLPIVRERAAGNLETTKQTRFRRWRVRTAKEAGGRVRRRLLCEFGGGMISVHDAFIRIPPTQRHCRLLRAGCRCRRNDAANASSIDACNANADFQEEVGCVFGSFHVISRKRKKSGRSWLRIGLPNQFALALGK